MSCPEDAGSPAFHICCAPMRGTPVAIDSWSLRSLLSVGCGNAMPRTLTRCAGVVALAIVPSLKGLSASAQAVQGVVVDDQSLSHVSTATVRVVQGDEAGRGTETDAQGRFFLPLPGNGEFRLEVSRLGYRTSRSQPFTVANDDTVSVEFRVAPDAILLDPITVTAHSRRGRNLFDEHMRDWGKGIFVTPQEIDSMNLQAPADVFRKMPDVKLTWRWGDLPGSVPGPVPNVRGPIPSVSSELGSGCLLYMVNNVMVRPPPWAKRAWTSWQLGDLLPEDIAAVEVYRSVSEVPPKLRRYTHQIRTDTRGNPRILANCGLVVFWTKSAW